ncbi:hypothetical protein HY230_06330 [Candidatus Acetothermia bacterium]|nr:hypothetical protein [Candidatus Acetothermia bacterium]
MTFSTTCGGTFSSTTTPNNGPANPLTIGPVALSPTTPIQVTYNSTGATPGMCTLTLQLKSATGETTTNSFTVTILSGFIHIYWANRNTGTIGRANLDGTGVNQSFITGASIPFGVAVGP